MALEENDVLELDFFNLISTFQIQEIMVKCENEGKEDDLDFIVEVHPRSDVFHQSFVKRFNLFGLTPGEREQTLILKLFLWRS